MPTEPAELAPAEPAPSRDVTTLPLIFGTIAVLALGVVMSIAALVAADDDASSTETSNVHVSLTEFAITPSAVNVPAGGTLHVTNDGTATHNLRVVDTDLKTPDLAAGDTGELDPSATCPPVTLLGAVRDPRPRRRRHVGAP